MSLMRLLAFGAQDRYLIGNPQLTYAKVVCDRMIKDNAKHDLELPCIMCGNHIKKGDEIIKTNCWHTYCYKCGVKKI